MVKYLLCFGLVVLMFGHFRGLAASELFRADELFGGVANTVIRRMSADGSTFIGDLDGDGGGHFVWSARTGRVTPEFLPYAVSPDGSRVWTSSRLDAEQCAVIGWSTDGSSATVDIPFSCPGGHLSVFRVSADEQAFVGLYQLNHSYKRISATIDGSVEERIFTDSTGVNPHHISSDGSAIVGFRSNTGVFRWSEETGYMVSLGVLPGYANYDYVGGYLSQGDVASADGSVVIGEVFEGPNGYNQAFRWTEDAGIVGLGFLEGHEDSAAYTVSSDGLIVLGRSRQGEFGSFQLGFVWDEANGMRSLQQVLKDEFGLSSELEDVRLSAALGISEDRQVLYGNFSTRRADNVRNEMWIAMLDRPAVAFEASDIVGDLTNDRVVDIHDADVLRSAVRDGSTELPYDLNSSGAVDGDDLTSLVHDTLHSWFGDANLDGQFSTNDLVTVFQAGQYEDTVENNSTWGTGDWNADGEFTTSDLVVAFQDGGYEMGPRVIAPAVPEPSTSLLLGLGVLAGSLRIQRRR